MTDQTPPTDRPLTAGDVLWMMHVIGPDEIYPAPDHATAVEWCANLNRAYPAQDVLCVAVPAIWTGSAESHESALTEAVRYWSRPATSAASEGEKLPDGAISGTDDGQTVWLESSTGGAHKLGVWGGLSLRFEEADGTHTIRDYVDAALASPPVSERERELEGALREARQNLIDCGDHFGAGRVADALTAQPQEPV